MAGRETVDTVPGEIRGGLVLVVLASISSSVCVCFGGCWKSSGVPRFSLPARVRRDADVIDEEWINISRQICVYISPTTPEPKLPTQTLRTSHPSLASAPPTAPPRVRRCGFESLLHERRLIIREPRSALSRTRASYRRGPQDPNTAPPAPPIGNLSSRKP